MLLEMRSWFREEYSIECKALAVKIQHLLNNSRSRPRGSSQAGIFVHLFQNVFEY